MEYAEGDNLTRIVEEAFGRLSIEFCKYSLYKTVLGLIHVHSENVIWRDLKSDNICVNAHGDFKFLDFDYSCLKNEEEQTF